MIKASEYCAKIFDGTHDTPKPTQDGEYLVTSKCLLDGKIDFSSAYKISKEDYNEVNRRSQVSQYDILFSMIGTIGNTYLEESSDINYAIKNIGVFSCRNREKAIFLYYYLQSPYAKKYIERGLDGAVQKFLSLEKMRNFPVPEFSESAYKAISELRRIDDKISTNNKIIETSERLMREIYDYWFVQFDFPDENGRPYKSSGGEMVYDEKLKREIPKEWKAIDLSDLIKNRTEATIGTHDDKCIDLSIMPSGNIVLDKYNFGDSFGSNMKTMKKGDILFGSIRPYLRKAGIAPYDGVRAGTVHCFYTKNTIDSSMCSVMMTSEDMFQYAIMKSGGSTRMPSVSAKDILSYSFAYNQEISSKYNDICSDLINQIILLINENISLASLRDWLLPLLMNGQIKVSD